MPRYEYVDHEGRAHVVTAASLRAAREQVEMHEYNRTGSIVLADRAAGTVELSDERARSRR